EDREQLVQLLHAAYEKNLLDAEALAMMEGVLQVSERQVREIMLPRAQMDVIDIGQLPETFIPFVIETAHSRFPVIDGDKDHIIGILLAKDLLRYYAGESFDVRDMLRPAVFVPEAKRLNVLLSDFRSKHNHIALVVNEYGGVSGMVTIEDVLEQIVGDISDEYDFDEDEDNIIVQDANHWRVKADTEIEAFNEVMGTEFSDEECDTVGGLVLLAAGQLPKRDDQIVIGNLSFTVLRADSRRLYSLLVTRTEARELAA
ncbi:MAG: HlyC/CorC family transporter, partial [Gallionella sp.]